MKRLLAITLMALVSLTLSVQSAAAWAGPTGGRPSLLGPGSPTGFYLWGTGNTLHLRSSSTAGLNFYSGRITTDGKFTYVHKVATEGEDSVAQVGPGAVTFSFNTFDLSDGVDLQVDGSTYVSLELLLNGAPIGTDHIYVGAANAHPAANPVVLPYN